MRLQLLLAALCATCTYCTGIRLRDISNEDQTKNLATDEGDLPPLPTSRLDGGDLRTLPPEKEDWRLSDYGDYEGLGLRKYLGDIDLSQKTERIVHQFADGGLPPHDRVEVEKPVPRPGENGGGLPPSRPGENGGGLPPLPPSRPGDNGGDLRTPPPDKGGDWRHSDYEGLGLRNYHGDIDLSQKTERIVHQFADGGLPPHDRVEVEKPVPRPGENGGGLPPSRPGENGGGLPPLPPSRPGENGGGLPPIAPSRPGENGGGLPPLPPSRPGENGGGLPPIYLRPGNAKCVAQRDPGPCRALIPRYHYDARTNSCRRFNYGGCLGNSNNFVSADDCQRSCVVQEKPKEPSHRHGEKPCWRNKRRCQGPAVTGPCRASIPRFYYDAGSNTCRSFIYGGCARNDNHWIHQKNCENVCLRKSKPSKCRNGDGNIFYIPPRRRHCPVMTCSKHCKHGYKRDKSGCATCHCLKHCKHRHHDRNNERHLIVNLDF